jgi:rhamnogalacturonan endolyase
LSTHKKHLTRRRLLAASAVGVAGTGAAVVAGTGLLSSASAATFGYTDDGSNYVIDTGASLVLKVSKSTGDITSLVYKGKEYEGYGASTRTSRPGSAPPRSPSSRSARRSW